MKVNDMHSGSTISELDKQNLLVLGFVFRKIRATASQGRNGDMSPDGALLEILTMADSMHNVPSMIRVEQACDAKALADGKCDYWPTGLSDDGIKKKGEKS